MHHIFLLYNIFLNGLLAFGRPQDTPNSVTSTPISITSWNSAGAIRTPRGSSSSTVSTEVVGVNENADSCDKLTQAMISIKTIDADTLRQEGGRSSNTVRLRIGQAIKTVLDVRADVTILRDLVLECSGLGVVACDGLYVDEPLHRQGNPTPDKSPGERQKRKPQAGRRTQEGRRC